MILLLGDKFFHRPGDGQGIFFLGLVYADQHGGFAVNGCLNGIFGKSIPDLGDAVQGDNFAFGTGQHDDIGQFSSRVFTSHGADTDFFALAANGTPGQIKIAATHRRGDRLKSQAILTQPFFGDLDADFVLTGSENTDLRD